MAFLREQIRNVERSEKRIHVPQERSERSNGRERDLQNQLLDIQENYTALSGRHAKLIAEIAKARDTEATQNDEIEGAMGSMGESAVERLKRSNSFAEAVEAVALEYEKTIQSLATSLSSTRSSLSTTENSLLERETKCAAVETLNQHLQARLQKLMDHESSVEHYLHDLEAKLDGHTSGEEKTSAIVIELRKEIARVRENEASCEDYISTLEERLAEADQDVELMQREIQRLEHVVERQRSVGKLDNLLYELDHAAPGVEKDTVVDPPPVNGQPTTPERGGTITRTITEETSKDLSGDDGYDTADEARRPSTIAGVEGHAAAEGVAGTVKEKAMLEPRTAAIRQRLPSDGEYPQQSLAQSKFMADKFETVTQELFDLRLEHEGTITELDLISAKYDESLRSLAELQDVVDEQRHPRSGDNFATPASTRPTSFLEDARVSELREGEQISTSRSLSSELFSAGASPSSTEPTEVEGASTRRSDVTRETSRAMTAQDERLAREMEQMKAFQADKDRSLQELAHRYAQLEEIHADTLDIVEELKADVTKAKMNGSTSPTTPVIRRKSSQNVMIIDRAHRSFASLRNLATENFDEKPDVMQNFELNLNTAMHELHSRSERVQELEADIASVKKEMESKMTIISGLTRERSSMKNSSPMDISVVSIMRDQLLRSENQIRMLQETHAEKEQGHRAEITRVKTELTARDVSNGKSTEDASRWHDEKSSAQEKRIGELETELSQWEARHQTAMASMKASEKQLLDTIGELETAMGSVEAMRIEQAGYPAESSRSLEMDDAPRMGTEHAALIGSLQRDLDSHRSLVNTHVQRISELEKSHAIAREELGQSVRSREASDADALSHRDLIESLKERICGHEHALQSHQKEVQSLHESHALQLDKAVAGQEESAVRLAEQTAQHEQAMHDLRQQLVNAKNTLDRVLHGASDVLEEQVTADNFSSLLQALRQNRSEAEAQYATAVKVAANAEKELKSLRATVSELTTMNEASVVEIERLNEEYRKSSRIVEELEDQLSSNYDQHQEANNRLSTMEGQRNRQLVEANIAKTQALAELAAVREEISRLEVSATHPPSFPFVQIH